MLAVQSKSRLNVLPLLLLRVAFTLALALVFTGVVGTHAEAAQAEKARTRSTSSTTLLPDLTISSVNAPSTAQPGQSIILSASIKNQGKVSVSTVQVAFYLTKSASSTTGATLLDTQNVGSLPAGASVTLTTTPLIPSSTSLGTFYVVAVADPSNAIKESNETNNTRASGAIAVKDLTPPTISGVNATQITASNATITWTTDKTSTSQADYGTTTAYGSSTSPDSSLVTSHAVTVSGLTAGTVYHFRVQSKDAAGNAALSSDYTFTTATATAGHTYFVATNGNDGDPGTEIQPFRTLVHGVSVLASGDTLYILSGTYTESLLDNIPAGTSWSAPVTVAAAPGHTVTLKPNPGAGWVLHFQGPQQYIVIDGLILDATNVTYDAVKITAGTGVGPAHHIQLIRCEVAYAPQNGILIAQLGADYNEFIDLNVHNNGTTRFYHGFYISTSNNLVQGSTIYNNYGYGVQVYDDTNPVDNNVVQGNNIYHNGIFGQTGGMVLGSGDGNTAYNNLIWGNWYGIDAGYGGTLPKNTALYNNTVYNNQAYGIYIESDTQNAVVRNNIVYANVWGDVRNYGISSVLDHNLVGIDPKFVNAASGDFHLQSGSPAIDTGTMLSAVTTDIVNTPRPEGAAYDIGAYELVP